MVFLHLTSCEAGALYPLCEGEKAGGCNSPKLTQGSLLPGGKEAGWPRLLLRFLSSQGSRLLAAAQFETRRF